jgi:hypothetical protein
MSVGAGTSRKPTIFVGYPWGVYSDREAYKRAYTKLEEEFGVSFVFAEDRLSDKHILEKVTEMILHADIGIYDVTAWNANVTLEYGLATGLERPAYIAFNSEKTDLNDVPADVRGFDRLQYSDFDQLSERLSDFLRSDLAAALANAPARRSSTAVELDVELIVRQAAIETIDLSKESLTAWVDAERSRLLDAYDESVEDPSQRSKEKYEAAIGTYLRGAINSLFPQLRTEAVVRSLGLVSLSIQNKTDENLSAAVVELQVHGEGIHAYFGKDHAGSYSAFPRPPVVWGQQRNPLLLGAGRFRPAADEERTLIDNYKGSQVEFPPIHLRPGSTQRLRNLFLVANSDFAGKVISIDWRVTTRSTSGSVSGSLELDVGAAVHKPLDLLPTGDVAS